MASVTMKINGREVKAEKGEPILSAIRAQGIKVPTLCHMDGLEPYGACRMCMVEVGSGERTKLVTSCNFPAEEGLEIKTDTKRVHRNRAMLAEILLARSPGAKKVQQLAASLGVTKSRFKTEEPTDCILCGLCVRVCDEIVGASAIGFEGRGTQRMVGTPFYVDPDTCIACGACSELCPTGAIHMEQLTKQRWKKEVGGTQRLCRYARMGLVSYKVCPNNLDCATCEVDQNLIDEYGTNPIFALAPGKKKRAKKLAQFMLKEDRYYSKGHTWVKVLGEHARIGMDDFAQRVVGEIASASLTVAPGDIVQKGQAAIEVSNNGHKATLLFPMSGKVTRVNQLLEDDPSVINEDCYQRGWLYMLEPEDQYRQSHELVSPSQSAHWLLAESDSLFGTITQSGGAALSDGGELLPNFSRNLSDKEWQKITERFFSKI